MILLHMKTASRWRQVTVLIRESLNSTDSFKCLINSRMKQITLFMYSITSALKNKVYSNYLFIKLLYKMSVTFAEVERVLKYSTSNMKFYLSTSKSTSLKFYSSKT